MGRAIALRFAGRGAQVLALDSREDRLEALEAECPGIELRSVDVTNGEAVAEAVGDGPWDVVVAAAGIGHTGRIVETSTGEHDRLMKVNFLGVVNTVKAVLPAMMAAGEGRIAVLASIAGWVPAAEHGPYGATKAALIMWCQALMKETRDSAITVTCVCPSVVATPLLDDMPAAKRGTRLVRPASPAKVADAVIEAIDRRREWVFPREARALQLLQRFAPRALDRVTGLILRSG
jgi:short-subunit dehydrogenase